MRRKMYNEFKYLVIIGLLITALSSIDNILDVIEKILIILVLFTLLYFISSKVIKNFKCKDKELKKEDIIRKIRNMSPREFEIFCGNIFKQLGYKVKITQETSDGGKDLILYNSNGTKVYVECKHFNDKNLVGREILQKLVGASVGGGAKKAIIITTSGYNNNAYNYAKSINWLELWTMKDILDTMNKIEKQWVVLCDIQG